jgi:hypothetical protein
VLEPSQSQSLLAFNACSQSALVAVEQVAVLLLAQEAVALVLVDILLAGHLFPTQ